MATHDITSPEQLFDLHPDVRIRRDTSGYLEIETDSAPELPNLVITALLLNRGNRGLIITAQRRDEESDSTSVDLLLGEGGSVDRPMATKVGSVPVSSLMRVTGEAVKLLDTYQALPDDMRTAFDALPGAEAKVSDAMDPEQELVLVGDKPSVIYRAHATELPVGILEIARQIFLPQTAEL